MHGGYDGWTSPRDVPMKPVDDVSWIAEVETAGRLVVDGVVRNPASPRGENHTATVLVGGLDPVDAHVHARATGRDPLGLDSLRIATCSGGMTHALVSWMD